MLPTDESYLAMVETAIGNWSLILRDSKFVLPFIKEDRIIPQHIYFLSDKDIKNISEFEDGTWVYDSVENIIFQVGNNGETNTYTYHLLENEYKLYEIIGSTNSELKIYESETLASASGFHLRTNDITIPTPTKETLKEFVKRYKAETLGKEVLIEVEEALVGQCNCPCHRAGNSIIHIMACCHPQRIQTVKVSSDNTLSILILEEKKSYTIEELIAFGKNCFYEGFNKAETDDANCFTAWREEAAQLIKNFQAPMINKVIDQYNCPHKNVKENISGGRFDECLDCGKIWG